MELYSLRYNLYNYLIKDNFDYISNKDYLFLWKNSLAILFIFIILIIVSHYNQIEVFSFFIIALIVFFLYIIYFEMKVTIDNYESNKHLLNYKNYYQLLNSIFIENYDFTIDDETNYQINKQSKIKYFDELFESINMNILNKDNRDKYGGYIKQSESSSEPPPKPKYNYLYLKITNYETTDKSDIYISLAKIFTDNNYHLFKAVLISDVTPREIHLEIDNLSKIKTNEDDKFILRNLISNVDNQGIINNMYIKLKQSEIINQKLENFPYLNSLIIDLIDKFNNDNISRFHNKFMKYAYESPDSRITDFFSSYFNIKQRIKNAIKYNENKTIEEINDNYYVKLINNRDILKYIDVYNDPDILKLKNYVFIRKEKGNQKGFYKYLLNYVENNDDYISLNEKSLSPEILKSDLIKEIRLTENAEPYEYYLINLNDMNNIRKDNNSNFNFMKEFIKNLNDKYNENYENFDIIYKTPNINQNREILNIVNNFNYIYIKIVILVIIIIAIIMHAFYIEYMRYLR